MSYQNFTNEPTMAGTQSNVTVIHSGQPVVATVQQRPYNPFATKAEVTKKLGIVQVVVGIISLIIGIIMIPASPSFFGAFAGGGIWSGIFIIISGALCIAAGSKPDVYGRRCGALTMCIISICVLIVCAILNFIAFAYGDEIAMCPQSCYSSSCFYSCNYVRVERGGRWFSLLLSIMTVGLFFITLFSAIYTGRGCCPGGSCCSGGDCCSGGNPSSASTYVMTQQGAGMGVSNCQTTMQQGPYPNQGYAPPTFAGNPPASGGYSHQESSVPGQQPYPSQGQQCTQASAAQGRVTYIADYSQQKEGIPETSNIDVEPPTYNPNQ